MNLSVPAGDERRVEVLASGLPGWGGKQLAVDATLRSALTTDGAAQPGAHDTNGAALQHAKQTKLSTYPEFASSARCQLVVVGVETGGRISDEAVDWITELAWARARAAPTHLRTAARLGFERRWKRLLACSAAFPTTAALLLDKDELRHIGMGESNPWLADVLADARRDIAAEG